MTKVIPCLCIVALLTALLTPRSVAAAPTMDDKADPNETRVFIKRKCVIAPVATDEAPDERRFIGGLLAVFIPILIKTALGRAAAALKKAGEPETLRDTGRLPTYLYYLHEKLPANLLAMWKKEREREEDEKPSKLQLNPEFRCVIVVRGTFKETGPLTPAQNSADEDRRKKLRDSNIPVNEIAALYEGGIKFADDRTALRYQSQFFQVNRFQGSRSQKEKRGMVVSISIAGAGQKDGEPLLSLALVNIGEVNQNTVLTAKDLETKSTSWLGGLALSDASVKALQNLKFVDPNTGKPRDYLEIMPINIEAGFTETEDGNKALKFIGEVLEAGAEDAAKALSEEILLDRTKKAEEAESALEALRADEESAFGEYLKARAELAKPDNPTAAQLRAREFEVERTLRVWCVKQGILRKLGIEKDRGVTCSMS